MRRDVRGGTAVLLGMLLSGCWLQPDHDGGRSRWNPHEQEIDASNVATLTRAWTFVMAEAAPSPITSGGRVYMGRTVGPGSLAVLALDAETGVVEWERRVTPVGATGGFMPYAPTIVGGEIWATWTAGVPGAPCWPTVTTRLDVDGNILGDVPGTPSRAPMAHGDVVVQVETPACPEPLDPATLVVRDVDTREVRWTSVGPGFGDVSVAGDWIVTKSAGFPVAGCGAPTCSPTWQPAVSAFDRPYVLDGAGPYFYNAASGGVGNPVGTARALSTTDGQLAWTGSFQGRPATMALDDDHLYVGSEDTPGLVAFDRDGCGRATCSPVWTAMPGGGAVSAAVAGDLVFVADVGQWVRVFPAEGCGAATCPELTAIPVPGADHIESVVVADGRLLVTSWLTNALGHRVYRVTAFELPD